MNAICSKLYCFLFFAIRPESDDTDTWLHDGINSEPGNISLKLVVNIDCPAEVELRDILFCVFMYHTVPDLVDAVDSVLDGINDAITLVTLIELEARS